MRPVQLQEKRVAAEQLTMPEKPGLEVRRGAQEEGVRVVRPGGGRAGAAATRRVDGAPVRGQATRH